MEISNNPELRNNPANEADREAQRRFLLLLYTLPGTDISPRTPVDVMIQRLNERITKLITTFDDGDQI